MYLDELATAARDLLAVANNPDVSRDELQKVLFAALSTLKRLSERQDFLSDLDTIDQIAKQKPEELKKILGTLEDFLVFFVTEQQLLLEKGLPADLVLALGIDARFLRDRIGETSFSRQAALDAISRLTTQLEQASEKMELLASDRQALQRASQGMTGLATIGINAKFLPAEFIVPGGSVLASGGLGLWLLKNSTDKSPIVDRLARFFTRRRKK